MRQALVAATACLTLAWACATTATVRRPVVTERWRDVTITATGRGAIPSDDPGPRGQALAERAATLNGQIRLVEQIYGLQVSSTTTIRDAVLSSDEIRTSLDSFVRGARVVATRRRPDLGIVEVDMELMLGKRFESIVFR
jgi:hypothetical protein